MKKKIQPSSKPVITNPGNVDRSVNFLKSGPGSHSLAEPAPLIKLKGARTQPRRKTGITDFITVIETATYSFPHSKPQGQGGFTGDS